jgi:hypothetical protein
MFKGGGTARMDPFKRVAGYSCPMRRRRDIILEKTAF